VTLITVIMVFDNFPSARDVRFFRLKPPVLFLFLVISMWDTLDSTSYDEFRDDL
jgi:hypothetical protein